MKKTSIAALIFAASERQRILDPFYRVLGSEQSGSGLGLSIVNAISLRAE